jgi:hypothetical protein
VIIEIAECVTIYACGLATGALLWFKPKLPTDKQIFDYMNRVVNQEEVEEHRRLLRVRMMRAGQKSIRLDGGPHARVMRMRIRPRPKGE